MTYAHQNTHHTNRTTSNKTSADTARRSDDIAHNLRLMASYRANDATSAAALAKSAQLLRAIPVAVPGQGWSTDKQMAAQLACLAPSNVTFDGGSKSVIALSNAVSFSDVESTLNTYSSMSGSIDQFSFSAASSYEQTIIQKRYDQAFYFTMTVTLPTQVFQPTGYGSGMLSSLGR